MDDPRIEIAARALRQIEHMLGVALSDAEHGSGPDHDPGQIMCDAMGAARELAFEAYRATLDAARPEVEGNAAVMRKALQYIEYGSPDDVAPFRSMPASEMQSIARRALTAARAPAAPDENALPMEMLPVGSRVWNLTFETHEYRDRPSNVWVFRYFENSDDRWGNSGWGHTPRAAMLAAIEASKDAKP